MRFGLVAMAAVSAAIATPTLAADWTGFYAGIYSGASLRNDSDLKGVLAFGQFDQDGGPDTPDVFVNSGGIDADLFDLLVDARNLFSNVPSGEAAGYILNGALSYAPGPTLGAVAGYSFGNGVRVESDWSVSRFTPVALTIDDLRMQEVSGGDTSGPDPDVWTWVLDNEDTTPGGSLDLGDASLSTSAAFILANAWYDFDNDTVFTPYLGGGVGLANVNSTLIIPGGGSDTNSAWVLAGQVGGGVIVDLNERSFLDLGYRLKAAAGQTSSVSAVQNLGNEQFVGLYLGQGGPVMVHTLQAGLNIRFD